MTTSRMAVLAALISFFPSGAFPQQEHRIDSAIRAIVTLCLAGGTVSRIEADGRNINIRTDTGNTIRLNRRDAQGFVDGFPSALNAYSADQAREARDCMRPHLRRIVDLILKDDDGDGDGDDHRSPHADKLRSTLNGILSNNIDFRQFHPQFLQMYGNHFPMFQNTLRGMGTIQTIRYIGEGQFGVRRFNVQMTNQAIICEIGLLNGQIFQFACT